MGSKDPGKPSGVRGPGGPPRAPRSGGGARPEPVASPRRAAFERASFPLLRVLHGAPRWVMVILPGVLLFGGLVASGDWAWLGGALMTLVAAFLAWLLALSWPLLGVGQRLVRAVTVVAVVGLAVLKFQGRF